jgi:hypothetical protein
LKQQRFLDTNETSSVCWIPFLKYWNLINIYHCFSARYLESSNL